MVDPEERRALCYSPASPGGTLVDELNSRARGDVLSAVTNVTPATCYRCRMSAPSSGVAPDAGLAVRLARALHNPPFPGLVSAYLFGSVAEGRAHRESDVDVGVYLDYGTYRAASARFEAQLRLFAQLSAALGRNDLDLVVMNDAPPTLSRHIMYSGSRLFCADEEADQAFRRTVLSRAADLEPFLRRTRRTMLEALAR